ncbi:MAG: hypothetical protein JSV25_02705 [Spirochaetota bacterium]|nr:MAG: hypothetical protein JSV25_02705 [Spirochaetota bacterium]
MKICSKCKKEVVIVEKIGRSATCKNCGAWLHSCVNCRFYTPGKHNDCNEPQAEYVRDKEGANFCDYFVFKENKPRESASVEDSKKSARDAFNKLFGDS